MTLKQKTNTWLSPSEIVTITKPAEILFSWAVTADTGATEKTDPAF